MKWHWEEQLNIVKRLIMHPIQFQDVKITLLDALNAGHPSDWAVEEHWHPWFEFNFVDSGACYTTLAGKEFYIEAGQSYLIPPGMIHSHRHANYTGDNGFCLRWQIAELEAVDLDGGHMRTRDKASDIIDVLSQPRPYAFDGNTELLLSFVKDSMGLASLQTAMIHWLWQLYESWKTDLVEPVEHRGKYDPLVEQVMIYMQNYYNKPLKVQNIADSLHVSYRNLARTFKEKTGLTLIEKLNDIRINEAKKLLMETDKTLGEIAGDTGFANEYYFSTIFRRYAMNSPTEFRENLKNKD